MNLRLKNNLPLTAKRKATEPVSTKLNKTPRLNNKLRVNLNNTTRLNAKLCVDHTKTPPKNNNSRGNPWVDRFFKILLSKVSKTNAYEFILKQNPQVFKREILRLNIMRQKPIAKVLTNCVQNINLSQYCDLLLLIWLDGIHDNYVKDGFLKWHSIQIQHRIFPESITIDRSNINYDTCLGGLLNFLENGDVSQQNLRKKIIESITTNKKIETFTQGWEKHVKLFLLYKYNNNITGGQGIDKINVPKNKGLLIAVDQQYNAQQEKPITGLIDGKGVLGLITIGQILDPGVTMLPKLVTTELQAIARASMRPTSVYNSRSKFALFGYKHVFKVDNTPVFKLDLSDIDGDTVKFNNNELPIRTTAARVSKPSKNAAELNKITKYFGDALQYILFTQLTKAPVSSKNTDRFMFLGSGDSMMLLGYKIFCDIEGVRPNMIIDSSGSHKKNIQCVNLPPNFNLGINTPTMVSSAMTMQNNNNNNGITSTIKPK
tara:strand:- start:3447 stop:4910 length:1464 start_codon:yes stop_codon:yes gene_type:complete